MQEQAYGAYLGLQLKSPLEMLSFSETSHISIRGDGIAVQVSPDKGIFHINEKTNNEIDCHKA